MEMPALRLRTVVTRTGWYLSVAAAMVFPGLLQAYSVGEPQLLSHYAQPLRLQVPVTLSNADEIADLSELTARLLPLSAYENLGLPAPPLSSQSVSIRVFGEGVSYTVEITTPQIVREPFLTLVLEVRARGVRVMRELPLLFDLPVEKPVAAPVPAAAPVALDAIVVAADAPNARPVAAAAAVVSDESATAPKPAIAPRQSAKSRRTLRLESLKLEPMAGESVAVTPAPPVVSSLPRFQLSTRFDSFAQRTAAGEVLEPAVPKAAPVAAPVLAPARGRAVPLHSPGAESQSESGGGFAGLLLAFLAGAFAAVLAMRWLQRRETGITTQAPEPQWAEAVAPVSPPSFADGDPVPSAIASVTLAPADSCAEPSEDAGQDAIHRRVRELRQGNNDLNLARKLQLVEAYLDLGRIESAAALLAELESGLPKAARPIFTLIKG